MLLQRSVVEEDVPEVVSDPYQLPARAATNNTTAYDVSELNRRYSIYEFETCNRT